MYRTLISEKYVNLEAEEEEVERTDVKNTKKRGKN
jgi:hypothetical protein